jgi:hypothetical protein
MIESSGLEIESMREDRIIEIDFPCFFVLVLSFEIFFLKFFDPGQNWRTVVFGEVNLVFFHFFLV